MTWLPLPQVMNHFGALDNDMLSKQKYALWRAAEIRKAIREGRPPAAPPGTDTVPSSEDTEDLNLTNSSFLAAGGSSFREQPPAPQGPPPGLPTLPGTGYPAVGTSASQPFVPPPPQMPPPPPLMPSPSTYHTAGTRRRAVTHKKPRQGCSCVTKPCTLCPMCTQGYREC